MGATSPELDRADREPALLTEARVSHLREKIVATKAHIQQLHEIGRQMQQAPDQQISPSWERPNQSNSQNSSL